MRRSCALVLVAGLGSVWACGSVPAPEPSHRRARGPVAGESLSPAAAARVVGLARSLLATPYRYAGVDPKGFDCSGLTSYVFGKVGLSLPRTARGQAFAGSWVAPDELARGDLVFFGDDRAKPYHVGLVVSEPGESLTMIHASTSRGVVETAVLTSSYWLPRLRFGRRVLDGD